MIEDINNFLKKYNYRAGIISFSRVKQLKSEINNLYEKKIISEKIYNSYLNNFSYNMAEDLFKPGSVIIVAAPRPQSRIYFNTDNGHISVIVPPTYVNQERMDKKIKELLDSCLSNTGYSVVPARLPEKLLAVHSGLGRYGRNNIFYIEGFGSFLHLSAFFSNIDCDYDRWYEKEEMEECLDCKICLENCPTGAINAKRFLISAERCLTFINEEQGDFPAWIKSDSHHCLVGCMRCQIVCPYNQPLIDWVEDVGEFTIEETENLLKGLSADKLPSSIVEKLKLLGLQGYINVISRNLKSLWEKSAGKQSKA